MQTQSKILILISALLLSFLSFIYITNISAHERESLIFREWESANRELFSELFSLKSKALDNLTADYSFWDDFVSFIKNPDPKWAREMLDTTPDTYKINCIWVYDSANKYVYDVNSESALGTNCHDLFSILVPAVNPLGTNTACHFFAWTQDGLMEVYGKSVHPSADKEKKTPPQGSFFAGMLWGEAALTDIERITRSKVLVSRLADKEQPVAVSDADKGLSVFSVNLSGQNGQIVAHAWVATEFPAIRALRANTRNDIRNTAIFGVLLLLLMALALTVWVSRPLRGISLALQKEDLSVIKPLMGTSNEFGQLADLIKLYFRQRKELQASMAQVKDLLNNTGQGILSFASDLLVDGNYSRECLRLFGHEINSAFFPEAIMPGRQSEQSILIDIFRQIFCENNEAKRGAYIALLPQEILLGGINIKLEFKYIQESGQSKVMAILTDITAQHQLEVERDGERSRLLMMVKIVAHSRDFFALLKDYQDFAGERLGHILSSEIPAGERINEIKRALHTFKGNFAIFEIQDMLKRIDKAEQDLDRLVHHNETCRSDMIAEMPFTGNDLTSWLAEDLSVLKKALGAEYFQHADILNIPKSALMCLEDKVRRQCAGSVSSDLIMMIRELRYVPIRTLLAFYPEYVVSLAGRLGKLIHPFSIEGGDVLVDPDIYGNLCKSLIHIFRNLADHGIEPPDLRVELGKSEHGQVKCSVTLLPDKLICIRISDDGRGIDYEGIENIARKKGLLAASGKQDSKAIADLIFHDGFSTRTKRTEISGMGIGLSAVQKEIARLGGHIKVNTEIGAGVEFVIVVPKK